MATSLEPIVVLSLIVGALAALVFAGVLAALIVFTIRFRDPRPGSVPQIHGHRGLEVAWTAAPLALLATIFALSLVTLGQIGQGATFGSLEPPVHVTVVGHQWWFEFRYPGGAVTANEAHIPAGVPIELDLGSADVIHDLWIPELGAKSDIVPGQRNVLRLFTARPGTFSGACAEFCGLEHAWMRVLIVAEPRADFERWLRSQAAPASGQAGRGLEVVRSAVCSSCHVVRGQLAGTSIGPDLTHVGSRATLAGGVLANTDEGMRAWIADPQRYKPGALMPRVPLSAADLDAVVAYLRSLR
ncbi:MAG TPA: cytochrome c oxidase subunit II [Candidatus Limnocylindria bacterium]|nr:cytochrome c oxidase subunit II [Candidatus Limnocylindria bacterium]